jgi:hypothetical protein
MRERTRFSSSSAKLAQKKYNFLVQNLQCQDCGKPAVVGHNCMGRSFTLSAMQSSIPVSGARKALLERKGFHEDSVPRGDFYRHPIYGQILIYPGRTFLIEFGPKTDLALDTYLESLPDSSYTDLGPRPHYETSCDTCKATGPVIPNDHSRFAHKSDCPLRLP